MSEEIPPLPSIEPTSEPLLKGFDVVPSDSIPYITIDNQRRFYLNTSARRLMDVKPYQRLAIAYNVEERTLAVIKPSFEYSAQDAAAMSVSSYNVDKRYYVSARYFVKQYGYKPEGAPYFFEYVHGKSDGTVFIFRLRG